MSSIKKRPDGQWRARYRGPDGREHARHFTRKIDAQRWLDEQTALMVSGTHVDPRDRTTVAEYARRWAASRPHKSGTARRTESMISVHIEGTPLGARRLASVLPPEVLGWVSGRAKVLAPSTLRQLVGLVRSVFTSAVADRLVVTSPATRLTLPSAERERIVPLSVEQVRGLAEAMAPRYRAMVYVQAGTGLRIGELLGLRLCDVDFLRRTGRVEHQAAQKTRELVPPKTPRSRRSVPLPKVAADALAAHLAEFPAGEPVGCACPATVTCSREHSGFAVPRRQRAARVARALRHEGDRRGGATGQRGDHRAQCGATRGQRQAHGAAASRHDLARLAPPLCERAAGGR